MNNADRQLPIPDTLSPPDSVCYKIDLPNDPVHLRIFFAYIYQLTFWFSWDRDDAHSGSELAARWLKAYQSIRRCQPDTTEGCCDGSEETLIRQNPDNPCLLESSADGVNWCTLFDQSLCNPANGQPGSGARQPLAGGGEECYHADFPSTMQWNLPTIVSAGDVIEIKNTDGQATDAPNHVWYCPNGQLFFAGKCTSVPFTQGGDPAVTANHMTIVCQIAGVWYPTNTPITVPGGVSNAPVVFQVNDGVLSDNSGGYSFDVCVTNNGALAWSHDLNFMLGQQGFAIYDNVSCGTGTHGSWSAGVGFVHGSCGGGGAFVRAVRVNRAFTVAHLTAMSIKWSAVNGPNGIGGLLHAGIYYVTPGNVQTLYKDVAPCAGTNRTIGDTIAVDAKELRIVVDTDYEATLGALAGSATLLSLHVEGTGFDPFA